MRDMWKRVIIPAMETINKFRNMPTNYYTILLQAANVGTIKITHEITRRR